MKTNLAALTALVSLIHIPHAYADGSSFTPLENLQPEQRQQISNRLNDITKNIEIDWDSIVVGISENGQITFRNKEDVRIQAAGGFSCLAAKASEECAK